MFDILLVLSVSFTYVLKNDVASFRSDMMYIAFAFAASVIVFVPFTSRKNDYAV